LAFASRHTDSDYDRSRRQRIIAAAVKVRRGAWLALGRAGAQKDVTDIPARQRPSWPGGRSSTAPSSSPVAGHG
jgi:hypothetical protein